MNDLMQKIDAAAVSTAKKIWLEAESGTQAEIEKLIVGERGFVRNNAWKLLVFNAAGFTALGWFLRATLHG